MTGNLDSGLSYFIEKSRKPRDRIHLSLHVKAGSMNEEPEERGYAHLIEHLAFRSRISMSNVSSFFVCDGALVSA